MIIAFVSPVSTGITFMEWSFNWLSGEKSYWHQENGLVDLVKDPLTDLNAHNHILNHPRYYQLNDFIKSIKAETSNTKKNLTFYPIAEGIDIFQHLIDFLHKENIKIVLVKQTKPYPYRDERKKPSKFLTDEQSIQKNWIGDTINLKKKKLREIVSVLIVKQEKEKLIKWTKIYKEIEPKAILTLTDHEWYSDPFTSIKKVFKKLDIKINKDKIEHWKKISIRWQSIINRLLINFYERDIYTITDCIIKNKKLDLSAFELDLMKEITIMSHLYKFYGLRLLLPTDNFPKNTQDLHKFLKK